MKYIGIAIFTAKINGFNSQLRSERLMFWATLLICVLSMRFVQASDQLLEMQYAEEIESYVGLGKNLWLTTPQGRFLSLYTETEHVENKGTVILLHARNSHPGQGWFIESARYFLAEHNWASLAIQLPVLGITADEDDYFDLFDEAKDRIQSAVGFLKSDNPRHIVLVGHDMGAMMGCYFLNRADPDFKRDIKAFVALSLPVPKSDHENAQIIDLMRSVSQPFLDIYLDSDLTEVVESARERRIAAKANEAYRQDLLHDGAYRIRPGDELLVKRIYGWLTRESFGAYEKKHNLP